MTRVAWFTAFLFLAALGLVIGLLYGCGTPDRLAMRTIVTMDGTRHPCTYGIERDGIGVRCYKESSRVFRHSTVERIEP